MEYFLKLDPTIGHKVILHKQQQLQQQNPWSYFMNVIWL